MARRKQRVKNRLCHTDNLNPKERRKAMRMVMGRDTTPERRVACVLRAMRVRFRRQGSGLPGKPDFVLTDLRTALFVHGCFWHQHGCRSGVPRTHRIYWLAKLLRNAKRDQRVRRELNRLGWTVIIFWECRVATGQRASANVARAVRFARSPRARGRRSI